jgi:hypothetical protein
MWSTKVVGFGARSLGCLRVGSSFSCFVGLLAYVVPAGAVPLPIRAVGAVADDYPDGSACSSRVAIDATFYVACTDFCVTDAQCPANWGCKPVTQGNGEDVWLCFPRRIVR